MTLDNTIIIATHNEGKLNEFKASFRPYGIEVRSLADYTDLPEIIEDGETFTENALIKAKLIAEHLQLPVLADDSGLCVDALGGEPGVYSARYAGEQATDADNNDKLLAELKLLSLNDPLSAAHFVCVLVLYYPEKGKVIEVEGTCSGYITATPRGENGFGYDPLFMLPEYNQTMAELSPELKNEISHRGAAIRKLLTAMKLSV